MALLHKGAGGLMPARGCQSSNPLRHLLLLVLCTYSSAQFELLDSDYGGEAPTQPENPADWVPFPPPPPPSPEPPAPPCAPPPPPPPVQDTQCVLDLKALTARDQVITYSDVDRNEFEEVSLGNSETTGYLIDRSQMEWEPVCPSAGGYSMCVTDHTSTIENIHEPYRDPGYHMWEDGLAGQVEWKYNYNVTTKENFNTGGRFYFRGDKRGLQGDILIAKFTVLPSTEPGSRTVFELRDQSIASGGFRLIFRPEPMPTAWKDYWYGVNQPPPPAPPPVPPRPDLGSLNPPPVPSSPPNPAPPPPPLYVDTRPPADETLFPRGHVIHGVLKDRRNFGWDRFWRDESYWEGNTTLEYEPFDFQQNKWLSFTVTLNYNVSSYTINMDETEYGPFPLLKYSSRVSLSRLRLAVYAQGHEVTRNFTEFKDRQWLEENDGEPRDPEEAAEDPWTWSHLTNTTATACIDSIDLWNNAGDLDIRQVYTNTFPEYLDKLTWYEREVKQLAGQGSQAAYERRKRFSNEGIPTPLSGWFITVEPGTMSTNFPWWCGNPYVTHHWELIERPPESLQHERLSIRNRDRADAYFRPAGRGNYTLRLTLQDPCATLTSDMHIEAMCNSQPIAVIGTSREDWAYEMCLDRMLFSQLDTIDAEDDTLSFQWTVIQTPGDSIVELSKADIWGRSGTYSPRPGVQFLYPDRTGYYTLRLNVTDGCTSDWAEVTEKEEWHWRCIWHFNAMVSTYTIAFSVIFTLLALMGYTQTIPVNPQHPQNISLDQQVMQALDFKEETVEQAEARREREKLEEFIGPEALTSAKDKSIFDESKEDEDESSEDDQPKKPKAKLKRKTKPPDKTQDKAQDKTADKAQDKTTDKAQDKTPDKAQAQDKTKGKSQLTPKDTPKGKPTAGAVTESVAGAVPVQRPGAPLQGGDAAVGRAARRRSAKRAESSGPAHGRSEAGPSQAATAPAGSEGRAVGPRVDDAASEGARRPENSQAALESVEGEVKGQAVLESVEREMKGRAVLESTQQQARGQGVTESARRGSRDGHEGEGGHGRAQGGGGADLVLPGGLDSGPVAESARGGRHGTENDDDDDYDYSYARADDGDDEHDDEYEDPPSDEGTGAAGGGRRFFKGILRRASVSASTVLTAPKKAASRMSVLRAHLPAFKLGRRRASQVSWYVERDLEGGGAAVGMDLPEEEQPWSARMYDRLVHKPYLHLRDLFFPRLYTDDVDELVQGETWQDEWDGPQLPRWKDLRWEKLRRKLPTDLRFLIWLTLVHEFALLLAYCVRPRSPPMNVGIFTGWWMGLVFGVNMSAELAYFVLSCAFAWVVLHAVVVWLIFKLPREMKDAKEFTELYKEKVKEALTEVGRKRKEELLNAHNPLKKVKEEKVLGFQSESEEEEEEEEVYHYNKPTTRAGKQVAAMKLDEDVDKAAIHAMSPAMQRYMLKQGKGVLEDKELKTEVAIKIPKILKYARPSEILKREKLIALCQWFVQRSMIASLALFTPAASACLHSLTCQYQDQQHPWRYWHLDAEVQCDRWNSYTQTAVAIASLLGFYIIALVAGLMGHKGDINLRMEPHYCVVALNLKLVLAGLGVMMEANMGRQLTQPDVGENMMWRHDVGVVAVCCTLLVLHFLVQSFRGFSMYINCLRSSFLAYASCVSLVCLLYKMAKGQEVLEEPAASFSPTGWTLFSFCPVIFAAAWVLNYPRSQMVALPRKPTYRMITARNMRLRALAYLSYYRYLSKEQQQLLHLRHLDPQSSIHQLLILSQSLHYDPAAVPDAHMIAHQLASRLGEYLMVGRHEGRINMTIQAFKYLLQHSITFLPACNAIASLNDKRGIIEWLLKEDKKRRQLVQVWESNKVTGDRLGFDDMSADELEALRLSKTPLPDDVDDELYNEAWADMFTPTQALARFWTWLTLKGYSAVKVYKPVLPTDPSFLQLIMDCMRHEEAAIRNSVLKCMQALAMGARGTEDEDESMVRRVRSEMLRKEQEKARYDLIVRALVREANLENLLESLQDDDPGVQSLARGLLHLCLTHASQLSHVLDAMYTLLDSWHLALVGPLDANVHEEQLALRLLDSYMRACEMKGQTVAEWMTQEKFFFLLRLMKAATSFAVRAAIVEFVRLLSTESALGHSLCLAWKAPEQLGLVKAGDEDQTVRWAAGQALDELMRSHSASAETMEALHRIGMPQSEEERRAQYQAEVEEYHRVLKAAYEQELEHAHHKSKGRISKQVEDAAKHPTRGRLNREEERREGTPDSEWAQGLRTAGLKRAVVRAREAEGGAVGRWHRRVEGRRERAAQAAYTAEDDRPKRPRNNAALRLAQAAAKAKPKEAALGTREAPTRSTTRPGGRAEPGPIKSAMAQREGAGREALSRAEVYSRASPLKGSAVRLGSPMKALHKAPK